MRLMAHPPAPRRVLVFYWFILLWFLLGAAAARRHQFGEHRTRHHHRYHHDNHANHHLVEPSGRPTAENQAENVFDSLRALQNAAKDSDNTNTAEKDINIIKETIPKLRSDFLQFLRAIKGLVSQFDTSSKLPSLPGEAGASNRDGHTTSTTTVTLYHASPTAVVPTLHSSDVPVREPTPQNPKTAAGTRAPLSSSRGRSTSTTTFYTTFTVRYTCTSTSLRTVKSSRPGFETSQTSTSSPLSISTVPLHSTRSGAKSKSNAISSLESLSTSTALATQPSSKSKSKSHTATPPSSTSAPPPSDFNPHASDNIIVYFGQHFGTPDSLLQLCQQPSVSIINLAFLSTFFARNKYPLTYFGSSCIAADATSYMGKTAPDLQDCTALGEAVQTCQQKYGKKLLVSLGGASGITSFPSATAAKQFASTVWNLFGAGIGANNPTATTPQQNKLLRPFGPDVIFDGFDIDNEDHSTLYWFEFASALRQLFSSTEAIATGKSFYLSSAPQCPIPDESIPVDVLALSDFVNIQYYNNPYCNANNKAGFPPSIKSWAQNLVISSSSSNPSSDASIPASTSVAAPSHSPSLNSSTAAKANQNTSIQVQKRQADELVKSTQRRSGLTLPQPPKLFVGLPAWPGGAGTGYLPSSSLSNTIQAAKKSLQQAGYPDIFGGVMLWDGPYALSNTDTDGDTFLSSVKDALAE